MTQTILKQAKRARRRKQIRAKISGTSAVPRLAVFKSVSSIYAQLIDDENGVTLASSSSLKINKGTKTNQAHEVGISLAKAAIEKGIKKVVFDRGGFVYTGRVKALADAAREGGLEF